MPADGVLHIGLAWLRGSLGMSRAAGRATVVVPAFRAAVCAVPEGPQAVRFAAAQILMPAGSVW